VENAELQAVVGWQSTELAELGARLADLEERLGRNPRNSSMPPPAGGFSKPPAPSRAERRAAARQQGKQPGAPGNRLAQVAAPDHVILLAPPSCSSCGVSLNDALVVDTERRQVSDLPEIRLVVTEHVAERRRCRCGCIAKASFPRVAIAPASYGPSVRAPAAHLAVNQHLPMDRMARSFSDVLGAPVSVGALARMVIEAADATKPFLEATRVLLHEAPVVHFDEAGGRAAGRLHWVHSASTGLLIPIDSHPKRGLAAMDDLGVIGAMCRVAIHDGWKTYRHYDIDHALGNAHSAAPGDHAEFFITPTISGSCGPSASGGTRLGQRPGRAAGRGQTRCRSGPRPWGRAPRRRHPALDPSSLRTTGGQGAQPQPGSRVRKASRV